MTDPNHQGIHTCDGRCAKKVTAAELVKKIPCWGDGIAGPKQCDESFECELHSHIHDVMNLAAQAAREEEQSLWRLDHDLQTKKAYASGAEAMREKAAKVIVDFWGAIEGKSELVERIRALPLTEAGKEKP
jgi:hypothetical protein